MKPTRLFRPTCIAMILVALNTNYAMSKRPVEDKTQDRKIVLAFNDKPAGETYLDTLNRGRELSLSDKDFVPIVPESTSATGIKSGKVEIPNGFRVQCFASSQIERVRAEQKIVETKVKFPIYIVYAAPYYKLLIGDFVSRPEADAAATRLKELGYADAWVMRTKVWANQ
jgi:hypothetical protein